MTSRDRVRDPCPWVILNDAGGAFVMGAVGGGLWHAVKGSRNAPRGERLNGALIGIKARAPTLGGNFATWGGLFSAFDCAIAGYRQKEDPWNSILSGAITGGVLSGRHGWKPALASAAFGGIILALIEGVGVAIQRISIAEQAKIPPPMPPAPAESQSPPTSSGQSSFDSQTSSPWDSSPSSSSGETVWSDTSKI
ncbi:Tim17/Tim22/Tim23/Pmp24 family-domain-containing protein [Paraphysoderma sedebokerense]|nr:Tim17/Tim22/Tim23/Pmp24 family-domain-containing protein [Paraphysoderma sedebokerense]